MIKYNKGCKVCKVLKTGDEALLQRIYDSRAYTKGGESLKSIASDYEGKFTYQNIFNHSRKHQNLTNDLLLESRMRMVEAKTKAKRLKQLMTHTDLRQSIMDAAAELLEKNELKGITASAALKAAKDASDIEEKQKDRALEMAKMINYFSSGELKRTENGLTGPSTDRLNAGV